MRSLFRGTAFAIVSATLILGAAADDKKAWVADASRGLRLSDRLCASCHVVGRGQTGSAVVGVPSFSALAKLPDQRISSTLIMPHAPMPDMQLTRHEIADIIAYIDDLRRKAAGKPPVDSAPRKKPKYPSES